MQPIHICQALAIDFQGCSTAGVQLGHHTCNTNARPDTAAGVGLTIDSCWNCPKNKHLQHQVPCSGLRGYRALGRLLGPHQKKVEAKLD